HLPLLEDQNPVRRSEIFAGTGSAKVALTEAIKSLSNVSGREADADHSVYRPPVRYILKPPDCSFHKTMGIQMQQSYKPGLIK
ncbi:hypothetical protein, partial [Salmonella enterica]|uniref:hypothetical protein n=7 Tax=Salmonella enterica TaxID=28901 RepID=UPI001E39657C